MNLVTLARTAVLSAAALLAAPAALADPGAGCHFHGSKPAAEATVVGCATQYKDKLVAGNKVEKSWQAVTKPEKVEQIDGKKGKEWRVTYSNPAEQDKSKATLYMFFTPAGNFVASNFTGQ